MKYKFYTKLPIPVPALQWTGENIDDIMNFMKWRNASHDKHTGLIIHTLEGNHKATIGDYIIKGVSGEFYPCKENIFKQTYVEVPDQ